MVVQRAHTPTVIELDKPFPRLTSRYTTPLKNLKALTNRSSGTTDNVHFDDELQVDIYITLCTTRNVWMLLSQGGDT
jgi:hypothetical protein